MPRSPGSTPSITGIALPGDQALIEAGPTMPRFAANLTMMFNEWPFLDRFAAAADAGFTAVEFLFPYEHTPDAIAARLGRNGLTQALFNLPPGRLGRRRARPGRAAGAT